MGLDIVAWRKLEKIDEGAVAPDDLSDGSYVLVDASPHFPGRTAGLVDGWYTGERDDAGEFKAGSYSGYGEWREWLAKLAGYPAMLKVDEATTPRHYHTASAWTITGGPFWELINFYDNEGEIGPIVSAKLARDFAEWDERARAATSSPDGEDGWKYDRYRLWWRAFTFASDGGCVEFC